MARYSPYLRVAHAFGMTLGELLGWPRPMGHLEFLMTHRWLELQWNEPSRADWYSMQNTAEIRAFRHSFTGGESVRIADLPLPFPKPGTTPQPPKTRLAPRNARPPRDRPTPDNIHDSDFNADPGPLEVFPQETVPSPYPAHVKTVPVKKMRLRPGAENKTPQELEREAKAIEAQWFARMGYDSKGRPKESGPLQKREPGLAEHDREQRKGRATPPQPAPPRQRKTRRGKDGGE